MPEKNINLIIGKNIRIRRGLKGFTQTTLAKRLGITYQQVQKYEQGRDAVSPAKLAQLSRMFDCSVEELFCDPASSALPVPDSRIMHLVSNFERIGCKNLQIQICDLVRILAGHKAIDSGREGC